MNKSLFGSILDFFYAPHKSHFRLLGLVLVSAALALFPCLVESQLQGQSVGSTQSNSSNTAALRLCTPRGTPLAAAGGQGLPGGLRGLGKFNPIAPKEPMVADPNRAFPRVLTLPGPVFTPVSYDTDPLIAQLAQSAGGIVRLPPGDYSIPVRFY